jgi:seryl-tRNA synthetase
MIDIKLIKQNPEIAKQSQIARGESAEKIDQLIELDNNYVKALGEFEKFRAEQKSVGQLIPKASPEEKPGLLAKTKELSTKVSELEKTAEQFKSERDELAYTVENVIEGAPSGGEEDYIVIKTVGENPVFDFEIKDHLDLGEGTDTIDTKRGAKVGGSRFYFLKGLGARLEFAMFQLAINKLNENGFTLMNTPVIVQPEIMQGTGFLGKHSAEVYRLELDDQYLVGTSEVALAGYHKDEIIDLTTGPIKYGGYSSCFRREAGSYGKDTRGIIRVHQFNKVEMFVYCSAEESFEIHKKLLAMEEEMIQAMELPYRVIDTAAGDLGSSAARKFDCEAWLPTQNRYLELTSTSNCTTYQARRLNIRSRNKEGKSEIAATLNGTLATTRWLVALYENHQNSDGSINIPAALQPYIGAKVIPTV